MVGLLDIGVFSFITAAVLLVARYARRVIPDRQPTVSTLRWRRIEYDGEPLAIHPWSQRLDFWLSIVLDRGAIALDSSTFLLLVACSAATAGIAMLVFSFPEPLCVATSLVVATAAVVAVYVKMVRRIAKFNRQFPTSLELMARATRSGENLESAMTVTADSSDEPLKSEFRQCIQQLQMGLSPEQVVTDLSHRIGSTDPKLFAHTIAMHTRIGGKLAVSLERLSSVIRERAEFAEKMKSATGIARFAIFAIVSIGFFVAIYMQIFEPDYIGKLFTAKLGRMLVAYGIVSEVVGLAWVAVTLKSEL